MGVGVYRPNPNKHIRSSIQDAAIVNIVGHLIIRRNIIMRSPEYVGALVMIGIFLLLKIGTVVAIYKASPNLAHYHAALEAARR
jgi:hypothetical protein